MSESRNINRRQALQNLGMMGVGAALASCIPAAQAQVTDNDVLNFALNLEYLEAEFYLAAVGRTPTYATTGTGTAGAVTGGRAVNFDNDLGGALPLAFRQAVRAYAEEIATDEENHVKFLRGALGGNAVARPAINIGSAFSAAANAAFGSPPGPALNPPFDPYDNALFFLHGAFIFEDVGVSAYTGAAALIKTPATLTAAAGILAVEAYHAGEIRTLLYQNRAAVSPYGATVETIVQNISNLRAAVGGGKDQGIVRNGGANIVLAADDTSIAFARSTREVLNIVYLAANATQGGFFPAGVNGTIKS